MFSNDVYNYSTRTSDIVPYYTKSLYFVHQNMNEDYADIPDIFYTCVEKLYCYNSNLNNLPHLSHSLKYLFCNNNNLIELPEIPLNLLILICNNNRIIELPNLHKGIIQFNCSSNPLMFINKENFEVFQNIQFNNWTYLCIDDTPVKQNYYYELYLIGSQLYIPSCI
jgi:Leucine-rich repeat (LRR) protein